jgi:CubicO group peptidase (beta-lactamase class C family)
VDGIVIEGTCDPRFGRVREAFAANFADREELGAGVAVIVDGRTVVELWGGHSDRARLHPWKRDTLVNVFSVGKGVTSLGLLLLVDRGLVDLDAPVARSWPEFAAAGKEGVTVRHLLSHQAGLAALRTVLPAGAMYDWTRMTTALAAERPWWEPGTRHGYHVNTFGFLIGEVVRRVSGVGVDEFLRRELTGPLEADFLIGVGPEHDHRVAPFVLHPDMAAIPTPDRSSLSEEHLLALHVYFNPPGASGHGTVNTTEWRRAVYPSTNAHATALGIARAYAPMASGGVVGGRRFLHRDLMNEARREHSAGMDVVLGRPSRFGLGFQLPNAERPIGPNDGVALHHGVGGALGFADPEAGIAFGYAMNRMGPRFSNPTTRALVDAVYTSLDSTG